MDDLHALEPWLALQRLTCFTLPQLLSLLEFFGTPENFLQADAARLDMLSSVQQAEIMALQKKRDRHPVYEQVKKDIADIEQLHLQVITLHDRRYPPLLRQIHRPPLLLYVKGRTDLLANTQLAIVGARKSGKTAQALAFDWAAELARQGLTITSGLALGIDGAAHQGALSVEGQTLAILAHGLDQLYPQQHEMLAGMISENGALVSEFPLGLPPRKDHFPRRNRIISGMSAGVLVVEAALKSGSLITARYALEQNRDVFAVPGSINNIMAQGCHQLIKDGAYLVESSTDILEAMAWQYRQQDFLAPPPVAMALAGTTQDLLQLIPFDPVHPDSLLQQSGLSIAEISSELMLLEAEGYIEMCSGKYQRIK